MTFQMEAGYGPTRKGERRYKRQITPQEQYLPEGEAIDSELQWLQMWFEDRFHNDHGGDPDFQRAVNLIEALSRQRPRKRTIPRAY
jgi:hypothetical protein